MTGGIGHNGAPRSASELANDLLAELSPRTAAPRARFDLAVAIGMACAYWEVGRFDLARDKLVGALPDAKAANALRKVEALLERLPS